MQLQAASDGIGLVCLPRALGDGVPGLEMLDTTTNAPPLRELWIGVHRDARHAPRIRAVLDHLTDGLKAVRPILAPIATRLEFAGRDGFILTERMLSLPVSHRSK